MESFLFCATVVTTNIFSVTLNAPISLLQTRMQCRNSLIKTGKINKPYTTMLRTVLRIRKEEGFKGFFKGNFMNIISKSLNNLFSKAHRDLMNSETPSSKDKTGMIDKIIKNPYLRLFPVLCITYPLEFAQIRLANNGIMRGGQPYFFNSKELFLKTWETEGIRGLYRGMGASIIQIFVYRVCFFAIYDCLLERNQYSSFESLVLASTVTAFASLLAYPFDTAKKRMMMTSLELQKYGNTGACIMRICKEQGIKALYHGFSVQFLRNISGSFILAGYDHLHSPVLPSK